MSRIILASGSPRRKDLLEQMGLEFEIWPAKGEEVITTNVPEDVVRELSEQKAQEVAAGILAYNEAHPDIVTPQDILVIGADTVVAYGGQILGKPQDEEDAKRMLSMLSGNVHSVYTGVTFVILGKDKRAGKSSFVEKTDVHMYTMSQQEIDGYVAEKTPVGRGGGMEQHNGEPRAYWEGKAGGYGIQDPFGMKYIKRIDGDYYNVVGLPVARVYQFLKDMGIEKEFLENGRV